MRCDKQPDIWYQRQCLSFEGLLAFRVKKSFFIQLLIWTIGYLLICLPSFDLTVGVFHGEGGGLLIAGSYGTIINALLFYGNANNYLKQFQQHHDAGKYLLHLLGAFTLLTALESALDLLVYHLLNIGNITSEVTEEIVWSNLLTHSIFFIVPSSVDSSRESPKPTGFSIPLLGTFVGSSLHMEGGPAISM